MKLFAIVLLVTAIVASSTKAKSQDTLRIEHLRSIDVCSGEQSWLLIGSMGSISVSDSLLSFDVIVMFDSLLIRPMDVLKESTLSKQLGYAGGPFLSLSYPGEFRISGFETMVPARGNLPLFAINGTYLNSCVMNTPFHVDFLEFNEEFRAKKNVSVFIDDTLHILNIKKPLNEALLAFNVDSDTSNKNEFVRRVQVLKLPEATDSALIKFSCENIQFDSIYNGSIKLELGPDSTVDYSLLRAQDEMKIFGKLIDSTISGNTTVSVVTQGGCSCKQYTRVEKTTFTYQTPTSLEEIDIDTENFSFTNGIIQYESRNPHVITIVDILGNIVKTYSLGSGFQQIPLDVSNGFYNLIWTSNGAQIRNKKILQNR